MTIELASQLHPARLLVQSCTELRLGSHSFLAMLTTEGWWTCHSGQVGGLPLHWHGMQAHLPHGS